MSIVVQIAAIETTTKGERVRARVNGIDLTSGDPFCGELEYEPGKWRQARWRSNGDMRDGPVAWNLVMKNDELKQLYEAAVKLGAKLT